MSGHIEFVSAGAGSGKTYKLTQTVAEALQRQQARPHGVLATTFTVKAAAELRERVRSWLLGQRRLLSPLFVSGFLSLPTPARWECGAKRTQCLWRPPGGRLAGKRDRKDQTSARRKT